MAIEKLSREFWEAITSNNPNYDSTFFYGVITTKIFCRPSCKSRDPQINNVRIFDGADEAINSGFRPCKRCKPNELNLPAYTLIDNICNYINEHYTETITLEHLENIFHGSQYHLQRTFKQGKGKSPQAYIHELRMETAKKLLENTDRSINDIGKDIGIPNSSYFITLFRKYFGLTPRVYRNRTTIVKYLQGKNALN